MNTIEEIVKKWQYKDGYVHIPDMIKEIEKHEDKVVKDLHDISGVQIKEREREAVEKYIRRNYKELSEQLFVETGEIINSPNGEKGKE